MTDTRWNGEPCTARRITAVVTDDGHFPGYWARDLVGTRRNAVEVTYGSQTFILDDEDGAGWAKVTSGGSPHHGHRSLDIDPDSVQERGADDRPDGEEEFGLQVEGATVAARDTLTALGEPGPAATEATEAAHQADADTCRLVEVDGQTILMRGTGELTEQEQQLAAEILRAAKVEYAEGEATTPADATCRIMETRTCPPSYYGPCGDRPCARFESDDPAPWTDGAEAPAAKGDAERADRRASIRNLLNRIDRYAAWTPDETALLRRHVEAELREADTAREDAQRQRLLGLSGIRAAKQLLERRTTTLRGRAARAEAAIDRVRALVAGIAHPASAGIKGYDIGRQEMATAVALAITEHEQPTTEASR